MSLLVHVIGMGQGAIAPFDGHLVRNLEWDRFSPEALDDSVDALVISPDGPADASALILDVRRAGHRLPVLVIADDSAVWQSVAGPDVRVVADVESISRHLGSPPAVTAQDEGETRAVIDLRRHVPRGGGRSLLRERLGEGGESIGRSMRDFDRALVREVQQAQTETTPRPSPATAAPQLPTQPSGRPAEADDLGASQTRRGRREKGDPDVLVTGLLEMTDRLYGVRETGTAVAGHLKDSVFVDAVVVLVPDGPLWTVAGAIGHRQLEERLTLSEEHWLVHEVCGAHHGVVVEDTDIARNRLTGAPLAAWPHLMACPLPDVRGLAILARSDNGPAFTSRDLGRASSALADADSLFRSALQLRKLARRLLTFAEVDDS